MVTNRSTVLFRAVCVVMLACSSPAAALAADAVVLLRDGRVVSGTVNVRTNNEWLWLHAAEPAIVLHSSFAWTDIVSARLDGKRVAAEELRLQAMKVRKPVDREQFKPLPPEPQVAPVDHPHPHIGERLIHPPPPVVESRVGSLQLEARVASWDNDPEDDGLLVTVYPLTADGQLRPVNGQLNLKLFGRVNQPSLNRRQFPVLTQNSIRVRASDFGPDGATYKFPFRNFHPEKNLDIDVFGLMTGRLAVAGHGTFDASDENVRLRRLSRFRDRLQFQTGERFLPAENRRRLP